MFLRTLATLILLLFPPPAYAQMEEIVNAIPAKIRNTTRDVHIREFAKIPDFRGSKPSRIVGIIGYENDLYVTTSVSDGIIHKVNSRGRVTPWFEINKVMLENTGRAMSTESSASGGIRGLAFHTNYKKNGLFYVSLIEDRMGQNTSEFKYFSLPKNPVNGDSVVLEFRTNVTTGMPRTDYVREVIRIGMDIFNHAIRQLAFRGPNLYITHGDASSDASGTIVGGGQRNDGMGKILRINPKQKGKKAYTIPVDNPFRGSTKFFPEIYALGLRNPHNICFSKRGELFVGDIGRDNVEEINIIKPGLNYGWDLREGPFRQLGGKGGLLTGIAPLDPDERPGKFEYPVAAWGHFGPRGSKNLGQAIIMSCPIENKSPLKQTLLYANFGTPGNLYLSFLGDLRRAVTSGRPSQLRMARTYRPNLFFDHDNDPRTPSIRMQNLVDIVRMEPGREAVEKSNCRFGQGKRGEIYMSSKETGKIYLITSSVPS